MRCSKCGSDNRKGRQFCRSCGSKLGTVCAKCGAANEADESFCGGCGTTLAADDNPNAPLQVSSSSTPEVRSQTEPASFADDERKTITALFADIKDSTELIRELDPEEARAIIDPVLQLMMDAVHRYEGYVAQSAGDGIFAMFGAPVAHEDHPQRALHAALMIQKGLQQLGEQLNARPPIAARIGVNTGEVVLRMINTGGRTEYSPVGHAANLASRMQTIASPGSIVITEECRRLVEGYFALRDLGPTEVKGIKEPVNVYEVIGPGPLQGHFELAAQRGLTRFVGRVHEIAELRGALGIAIGGRGQIIAVVGEAGTGKSRLFYEFKATLAAECRLLHAYSVSHGKASAWLPVLDLLRGYFGIQNVDDSASRREKVRDKLEALDLPVGEIVPYLFGLLAIQEDPDPLAQMDTRIRRQRTLGAMKRVILRESLEYPLILIFEDLHWIDGGTEALLELLADGIANARILLLVSYRPEYHQEWGGKNYTQLRLDPLDRERSEELLTALLGDAVELGPLKRLVADKTGGNPFFIEEIVRALFDEGTLVRNGSVRIARSTSQLRVPPTVQGILASRIDRLSGEHKQLLQTLAVMGTKSPLGLIRQVVFSGKTRLEQMLADLQAGGFVYEQPAPTGLEYTFKHALTQEVAYSSLLIERRKLLHERTAEALESTFGGHLDDQLALLAHHYGRSDNVRKAVEYLGRAGQQALQRSAHAEAVGILTTALSLLQTFPDTPERSQRELHLQLALGPGLMAVKGFAAPEVEQAFTRARDLCERLGDPPQLFPALSGLRVMYLVRAELRTAYELAERLLRQAQIVHDPALLLHAHLALGQTAFYMGEFLSAREHLQTALSLYERERHQSLTRHAGVDVGVPSLCTAAWTLWHLGYPDQSIKRVNEALALTQGLSQPFSLVFAQHFLGVIRQLRREIPAAQEAAEDVIALSAEHGFSFWLAVATSRRGWALVEEGRNDEGIAQIEEGLATSRAIGAEVSRSYWLSVLAEACTETGRIGYGLDALAHALAEADRHEEHYHEAEIHRLKGVLLLRQHDPNDAEARKCFQRAIEIARKQSAKSFELRATTSLARLLAKLGSPDEAHGMLAEIYNWFTEGFDTADLKEAKALLEELAK
jgi:class 3 adenylate cyclase/predicted ATPase